MWFSKGHRKTDALFFAMALVIACFGSWGFPDLNLTQVYFGFIGFTIVLMAVGVHNDMGPVAWCFATACNTVVYFYLFRLCLKLWRRFAPKR